MLCLRSSAIFLSPTAGDWSISITVCHVKGGDCAFSQELKTLIKHSVGSCGYFSSSSVMESRPMFRLYANSFHLAGIWAATPLRKAAEEGGELRVEGPVFCSAATMLDSLVESSSANAILVDTTGLCSEGVSPPVLAPVCSLLPVKQRG